ncbi:MAG TPA: metal ABC transporter ATP-binding protein [Actinomycetota bacterium]
MTVRRAASGAPVLEARSISFAYGAEPVLEDVSFAIEPGEFVALVGPNGSGKSTLLRILLGLLPAASGSAVVLGGDPSSVREPWRIGYVPQRHVLSFDLPATVREVVAAGRVARRGWWRQPGAADRRAVDEALDAVGLADLRARRIRELSGGQQQRALIAKALASAPELLILDEPVAGVDAASQRRFRDSLVAAVRERGAAVLLVSHELGAVAEDLDRVIVLRRRVLFDGTPRTLAETGVSLGVHAGDLPLWLEGLR